MPQTPAIPFRCPICRSQIYMAVTVRRPSGKTYRTEFFECGGCSVMFRDPQKFTRFDPHGAEVRRTPDLTRAWPRVAKNDSVSE